jgi:thiamine biosynthesis protein ThiI
LYDVILLRYGELALKGGNRPYFERTLRKNILKALPGLAPRDIKKGQGRLFVEVGGRDEDELLDALQRVFGLVSMSPAVRAPLDMDSIEDVVLAVAKDAIPTGATFKVNTRRANKAFPLESPQVSRLLGAHILSHLPGIRVDVHNPEFTIEVEIREEYAYIMGKVIPGPGGLPLGTSGKGILLLSGGLDSPVAGWMCMRRGLSLTPLHFHSFPFTSERSKEKVIDLCGALAGYAGEQELLVAPFTTIQEEIQRKIPEELRVIVMRRMMMRIAQRVADERGALTIVTGESLGQVASQTLESINVTNQVASLPVFRPLIGMDKNEIMDIARKIGTYDISIRPYEDCCTLFVPRHPETRPDPRRVEEAEETMDIPALVAGAVEGIEFIVITRR